jgi:nitric oxide reductase subunit B
MRRIWISLIVVVVASFALLGWVGSRIYQQAPPIPARVIAPDGHVVLDGADIREGQEIWAALGGQEVGSVWGHGSYVAPDWTADLLHAEVMTVLDIRAHATTNQAYHMLPAIEQAPLREAVKAEYRHAAVDSSGTLAISAERAQAFDEDVRRYTDVFMRGEPSYAIPAGSIRDETDARKLTAFFFWTAWAASANRPGANITYTSNWPHEELIGNVPTPDAVVWTGVSIILLLAGIGALGLWHATRGAPAPSTPPVHDPLLGMLSTPSQRATIKYFWVVCGLIVAQVALGIVVAHYGVEGNGFYGIPLASILPYSVARTWHTQLGIFWIATAWLGAGLMIAPAVGHEPKGQRVLVDVLFAALLVVVVGSMAGELASVHGWLRGTSWWLFGHSGYEYIDLGRAFQVALLVGLALWCALVVRAIRPALARRDDQRSVLVLFLLSTIAIAGFYFAALGAGRTTNLAIAEYWRWWVVHLWVEGFFEVFATAVIAFLLVRLGLVDAKLAGRSTVLAAAIFLSGGIVGTLHHLYFTGTPTAALAFGSVFSALEVVPLVFVGFDAWENYRLTRATTWMRSYRWPIYFFVGVGFWNLVGAGLFGFMINPPIALYYMQGLNTTPVHGHAALFGVYGLLGMGLVLFTVHWAHPTVAWPERWLRFSFWAMNGGLLAMLLFSVLPVGLLQTWASVEHGYWFARSSDFLQTPIMSTLRWMRVFGDTTFALGAIAFVGAVLRATTRREARVVRGTPRPAHA